MCVEKTLTFFLYGNFLCVRIHSKFFVWEKMYGNFLYGKKCMVIFCMGALHSNFLYGKNTNIFLYVIFFACNT